MQLLEFCKTFVSDCSEGLADQAVLPLPETASVVGRCRFHLRRGGERYALLFGNTADSTYSDGSVTRVGSEGGRWTVDGITLRLCRADRSCGEPVAVTFSGSRSYEVTAPGFFASDPVFLGAEAGDELEYEIRLTGRVFPSHPELQLSCETIVNGTASAGCRFPVPVMIGTDRPARAVVGFLGDSITQGIGPGCDSPDHWVRRIADGLPADVAVWNLGIGFARAADASTDGTWLARAKCCGTVNVCLGVNDLSRGRTADDVARDLSAICRTLSDAGCRTVLFSVPPFDFTGAVGDEWYRLNDWIRTHAAETADAFFDMCAPLAAPPPDGHRAVFGGHPNRDGCCAVADAYLAAEVL